MKKALLLTFAALVACALLTTPTQAAQTAKPGLTLVKHKHKKHKKKHHRE